MPEATHSSNGYEDVAQPFMASRSSRIGVATVREWSRALAPAASVLDLGCGHGVPISEMLIAAGFDVHGVDGSPTLISAFRERFPQAPSECASVEESSFFDRSFDAIVAWGLIFLLPPEVQRLVIAKAARALKPGGRFLFTSPAAAVTWPDALTRRESISLGRAGYEAALSASGLTLVGTTWDEGENHYYVAMR
jgi:SAM-dependent methyltransferase